jgi:hypothetical protein
MSSAEGAGTASVGHGKDWTFSYGVFGKEHPKDTVAERALEIAKADSVASGITQQLLGFTMQRYERLAGCGWPQFACQQTIAVSKVNAANVPTQSPANRFELSIHLPEFLLRLLPFCYLWGFQEVCKLLILLVELVRIELTTS